MSLARAPRESDAEWLDLHNELPEPTRPPGEHCEVHGDYVPHSLLDGDCHHCRNDDDTRRDRARLHAPWASSDYADRADAAHDHRTEHGD